MKKLVKAEVLKVLDVDIIYPIIGSKEISPTQVVLKMSGVTALRNEDGEMAPIVLLLASACV